VKQRARRRDAAKHYTPAARNRRMATAVSGWMAETERILKIEMARNGAPTNFRLTLPEQYWKKVAA
jgi:hypothetical protein